jgi:thiol-disulfide isomerase/thioredoxin
MKNINGSLMIKIGKMRLYLWQLPILVLGLCLVATTAYGEIDTAAFEEDFDIIRYQQNAPAPDFTTTDLDQKLYRLQDFQHKFVMLNFWASWCMPCVRELPALEKLRGALPESDFEIIAINVRDRESRLRKFMSTRLFGFAMPLDRTGDIYKAYEVSSFPTTFLIDREGRLFGRINGARYWMKDGFVAYMKQLIKHGAKNE